MAALARRHSEILVALSGGKDSLAVMDICAKSFPKVQAFFKYLVPGLAVLEKQFQFAQDRYGIEVFQFPCNATLEAQAAGIWCDSVADFKIPQGGIPLKLSFAYALEVSGCPIMATGMKDADGLPRRQFFANIRDGGDSLWNRVIHPLRAWSKKDVLDYLKANNIPLPSQEGGATGGVGLNHDSLCWLHDNHPEDFAKLLKWFPYAGAAVKRREWFGV